MKSFVTEISACVLNLPRSARALVRWKGRVCGWQPSLALQQRRQSAGQVPLKVTKPPQLPPPRRTRGAGEGSERQRRDSRERREGGYGGSRGHPHDTAGPGRAGPSIAASSCPCGAGAAAGSQLCPHNVEREGRERERGGKRKGRGSASSARPPALSAASRPQRAAPATSGHPRAPR